MDLNLLQGKIGPATKIYISAHGEIIDGHHTIEGGLTRVFLEKLASYSEGQALHVQIAACFIGAAADYVSVLPVGSVLVTHGVSDDSTSTALGNTVILEASRNLNALDPIQDFLYHFALNARQTVTISINKADGIIFQYTVLPPQQLLAAFEDSAVYLERQRIGFAQEVAKGNDDRTLYEDLLLFCQKNPITQSQAIEWRNDIFITMATYGYAALNEALQAQPNAFSSFINYSDSDDMSALSWAAKCGRRDTVRALFAVPDININKVDITGYTALDYAASSNSGDTITALLSHPSTIGRDKALETAASFGNVEAIRAFLRYAGYDYSGVYQLVVGKAVSSGNSEAVIAFLNAPYIDGDFKTSCIEHIRKLLINTRRVVNMKTLSDAVKQWQDAATQAAQVELVDEEKHGEENGEDKVATGVALHSSVESIADGQAEDAEASLDSLDSSGFTPGGGGGAVSSENSKDEKLLIMHSLSNGQIDSLYFTALPPSDNNGAATDIISAVYAKYGLADLPESIAQERKDSHVWKGVQKLLSLEYIVSFPNSQSIEEHSEADSIKLYGLDQSSSTSDEHAQANNTSHGGIISLIGDSGSMPDNCIIGDEMHGGCLFQQQYIVLNSL